MLCAQLAAVGQPSSGTVAPAQPAAVPFGGQLPAAAIARLPSAPVLAWDAELKECQLKPGETKATVSFAFTNIAAKEIQIMRVTPSCGCTVVKLPSYPWKIPPGGSGQIDAAIDLANKRGTLMKTLTVATDYGDPRVLSIKLIIPDAPVEAAGTDRLRNQELAKVDRQAVFKGDCATCHLVPALGRTGKILFQSACGVCHEATHRATMVPDLRAPRGPRAREYWIQWITFGRHGSLMPAFSRFEGGPFTESQIDSLVEYLTGPFLKEPRPAGPLVAE